jgi:hypothetical protein
MMANLLPEENLPRVEAVMRRAAKAGYNGIVLSDSKFAILDKMDDRYFKHAEQIKTLANELKLEIIPTVFDIGYSSGVLAHDPNLVEAFPVQDAPFVVHSGKADISQEQAPVFKNGGFEETQGDKATGWDFQDAIGKATFIDHDVKRSGAASLRIDNVGKNNTESGNGRIVQKIKLVPHRYYRLSFWAKTKEFESAGSVNVAILPAGGGDRSLSHLSLNVQRNQDWTLHQTTFNSLSYSEASVYMGVWGGKGGQMWLDDVALEELGLLNVVRRKGCPFSVKSQDGIVYEEGRDFQPVKDDRLGVIPWPGEFELYHTPPAITLTPNSRIKEGQKLRVSFYHPLFVYAMQTPCCLTDPKVYEVLRDQMQRMEKLFHPSAVLMGYDELRIANWCETCLAQKKTPGQLLADSARKSTQIVRQVSPQARIYTWNDMFDPFHNAHDNYYLVNGTFAGSWEGLPPDVGIVNWYFEPRKKNLPFFADRGHKQILAGYYDNNVEYTVEWLKDSLGVKGIEGVMYTTWQNRYDDLEKFAQTVWGGAH